MMQNYMLRLLFIICGVGLLSIAPLMGQWSDEIKISEGANPDIDINWKTGEVYILSMYEGITITKLDMEGKTLSQEIVPPAASDVGGMRWGGSIAVGPDGNPHVVFRQFHGSNNFSAFYTHKSGSWSSPLRIHARLYRAWQPRIDVDAQGRAHIGYGYGHDSSIHGDVYYRRVENGAITAQKDGMTGYRADVNWELCATPDGEIHLITGKAAYPPGGGPISYFNSLDGGGTWEGYGDIHDPDAKNANGFVDISQDAQKNFHVCYSTEKDQAHNTPAIRYAKIKNNKKVLDVLVTDKNEIKVEHLKLGLSSVAASEDGQFVMITYITGQNGGDLYARLSENGGQTWSDREKLAPEINSLEGRSRHYIRSYKHRFYLVYPYQGIKFRYYQVPGFEGPKLKINGPYTGTEGTPVEFSAAGSEDPDGIASFAWDWNNDGVFDDSTASETISHTFTDDYADTVALKARGTSSGKVSIVKTTITIANVPPAVDLGGDISKKEGKEIEFTATVTDPGTVDTHTYLWDFGDGVTSNATEPTHSYADNGTYPVKLSVTDDDGGKTDVEITATIANAAPVADAGGPYNVKPNEEIQVHGTGTDPGSADVLTYKWDLDNDGTFETDGQDASVQFATNGSYIIKLRVKDDDGDRTDDDATIVVGSAAPKIATIPEQRINEGQSFAPIKLDNYVDDPDDPDTSLTWNAEGNNDLDITISNRIATVTTPNENWYGQEDLLFIAHDPGGESDSATVKFVVEPINDPPVVKAITNQTRDEGKPFQTITLDNYVTDEDNNPTQITWTNIGEADLKVTIVNRVASIAPVDSEWAGTEELTFIATDPAGANDQTSASFTINPINDPPMINNFPDQEMLQFEEFQPLNLDETVYDPDHEDNLLTWTFFGNNKLNLTVTNRVLTVTQTNKQWFGTENITFVVTDPNDKQATKTVNFTVKKVEAKPTIRKIANQTIKEGETFTPIKLDDYVADLNNQPAEMNWSGYGQNDLQISFTNRILKVKTPHENWSGTETISLIVVDPENLKDTTDVVFTVEEVNDPPEIAWVSEIIFDEDTSYDIPLNQLRQATTDNDHDVTLLEFGLKDNNKVLWEIRPLEDKLHIYAVPNFSGFEIVTLYAKDPAGEMGVQALIIKVNEIKEPLSAFTIVSPINDSVFVWQKNMEFMWTKSVDPDPGDRVEYQWLLSRTETFIDTFHNIFVGSDTLYDHPASKTMWAGQYYWKIIAFSSDGSYKTSPVGKLHTLVTDIEETARLELPTTFTLLPNHPNPFNPETQITFVLPRQASVKLAVYNSLGQQVKQLINEEKEAGAHHVVWDATDESGSRVSSGIYVCQIQTSLGNQYIKMLLVK